MQSIPHRPTNDQLRALPLADLMAYAHRLCAELPDKFLTPDRAWQWLRLSIEPMAWEIETVETASGPMYAAWFGGEVIVSIPKHHPDDYDRISTLMDVWFNELYPRTLSSGRWCITHVAQPVEVN